jgi:hypothetical protein
MKSILFLILILGSVSMVFSQNSSKTENELRKEAERLWELAIQAKGGRERLHNIRNMFISSQTQYYWGVKKITNRRESLYVFPNKWWVWDDNRPSVFGLTMEMYNLETRKKYLVTDGQKNVGLQPIESNYKSTNFSALVTDLMETKWNQPTPEKVYSGKEGKDKVDIVQIILIGQRIDFALDKRTHLPVRVIAYLNEKPSYNARLLDYVDVSGIKMPSRIVLEDKYDKTEYKRTYKFNIEYNEDIFKTPPLPIESAASAWKKRN